MPAFFSKSFSAALFFASFISSVSMAQQGILPADYYKTVFVSQTGISPDGEYVAFTRTVIDEENNSRHSEVWMQKLRNGQPDGEAFRFTDPTVQSSSPRWSPDGTLLSIQSRRGDDDNSVRFLRVTAPGGEAFTIEGLDRQPVWSPDGSRIAYTRVPESDRDLPARAGWISPDAITTTLDSTRFDGRVITQMRYKSDGRTAWLPHPSINEKEQIFLVPSEGGEPEQLTELPFDANNLEWSPNGTRIYFTGDPMEDDEYNTDYTGNMYVMDLQTGDWELLLEMDGTQSSPIVSPNGRFLAFTNTAERGAQTDLYLAILDAEGNISGDPRNLTGTPRGLIEPWDRDVNGINWSSDSNLIRFSAAINGNSHLFQAHRDDGQVTQLTQGDRRLSSFSFMEEGPWMTYTATDAVTPSEVYVARSADGSREMQITDFNSEWLSERTINPAERITWTVDDGTEIEGWVIKPVGYEEGTSYPIIMKIHGGPHSYYGNTWFQAFHVFSASGFFVFYPNPRGSTSYGNDFTYATRGKWGVMDEEDFMTGLDTVLDTYPDADPERVGVSGGSYGGFMTNWLTARFPDRFQAAVTSRSISNWESWYGSSDVPSLTDFEFYGAPWEQRELYRELSPISYVENVTAPTLIIHSEEDWRTPIGDGEQWYIALKKMQVPVEFVPYPRSSHGLSRTGEPWLLVDRLERQRSWFDHWLNGQN